VEVLISLLVDPDGGPSLSRGERGDLQRRILRLLRKYAHRKYQDSFADTVQRLWDLVGDARNDPGEWQVLSRGLPAIESLARTRFEG
jgi:hypothetical protein